MKRDGVIQFRVSKRDLEHIRKMADDADLSVSQLIRRRLLGLEGPIELPSHAEAISKIRDTVYDDGSHPRGRPNCRSCRGKGGGHNDQTGEWEPCPCTNA